MRLLSWNVNGIRAIAKKGFIDWLVKESPDIIGIQETKAHPAQLTDEVLHPKGYYSFWNAAERKGYSGVAVYTKKEPLNVFYGLDLKGKDQEGRVLILEYAQFYFLSIYFPNGRMNPERLRFKLAFYKTFQETINRLKISGKNIIICCDLNTAHTEIDLAHPKENASLSGFLPEERGWVDSFLDLGMIDTFRVFNKDANNYTWWDYKTRARERNIGWRLDYVFMNGENIDTLKNAFIYDEITGSDHCPVGIDVENKER